MENVSEAMGAAPRELGFGLADRFLFVGRQRLDSRRQYKPALFTRDVELVTFVDGELFPNVCRERKRHFATPHDSAWYRPCFCCHAKSIPQV
jgi:hypothetical protein